MRYEAYIDGSFSHKTKVGGWAYVILDEFGNKIFEDSGAINFATNNISELLALKNLLEKIRLNSSLQIYSDSEYLVNMLTIYKTNFLNNPHNYANSSLILEILSIIEEKGLKVEFNWVKAHASNSYNNYVDKLAKKARKELEEKEEDFANKTNIDPLFFYDLISFVLDNKPKGYFLGIKNANENDDKKLKITIDGEIFCESKKENLKEKILEAFSKFENFDNLVIGGLGEDIVVVKEKT